MINNLVQLSNLFNKIVFLHPVLQSYNFGWRNDARVDNNYTLEQSLGKLYPRVTFTPPTIVHNVLKGFDNVSVQLFFDDLLYYDNQSNQKTKTKLETMADLMQSAKEFLQEVRVKGRLLNLAVVGETVNITLDESTLIDRNIQVILEFTVIYTSSVACLNLDFEQEKADYPYPFESWDYEDGTRRTDATYMNEPIPTP